jgi:Ca2+-binding EF-hand superfamily protein/tetratricopeptide (TPR) repeat protein
MTTSFEQDPQELLSILEETSSTLRSKGKFIEAVSVMWQSLHLRVESKGREAPEVANKSQELIKLLNKLAVQAIRDGQYDDCIGFLGRALKLSDPDAIPNLEHYRILTLNNASCCHRRLGNTQLALKYAKDALNVGFETRDDRSLACSHLNACSVLSQAGRHEEALRHARDAVNCSLQALRSSQNDGSGDEFNDREEEQFDQEEKARLNHEQLATLCIAYHNAGVEFEHLGRNECLQLYRRALNLAELHLPRKRKMAAKFRASLQSAQRTAQRYGRSMGLSIDSSVVEKEKRHGGKRPRPNSAPSNRKNLLPAMNGAANYGDGSTEISVDDNGVSSSASPSSLSVQLKMAREKVLELEREMNGGTDGNNDGNNDGPAADELSSTVKSSAFREELDQLHQRTESALLSLKKQQQQQKKKVTRMVSSASGPILRGHPMNLSINEESAQSLKIENAGMIVMGPGLMSGVGPTIFGKGMKGSNTDKTKKARRKRPASAGSARKKKKKLPPWAKSKAPDWDNMSESNLMAVRIFYKLFLVLEKRRARAMDIFREFDADDSGTINGREFREGCKTLGITIKKAQRKAVFGMIDDDNSGDLDYMELGKEIKKAGKHPPPLSPVDVAAASVAAAANDSKKKKTRNDASSEVGGHFKTLKTNDKNRSKKGKNGKQVKIVAGPPKLNIESMIKWCSSRLVSDINLRAYLQAHHSIYPASQTNKEGKTVLHALCANSKVSVKLLQIFLSANEKHKEQASMVDEQDSSPLHLLSKKLVKNSLEMIEKICELSLSMVLKLDQAGKTPLMYAYEKSCTSPLSNELNVVEYLIEKTCLPTMLPKINSVDNSSQSADSNNIIAVSDRPERSGIYRNNALHSLLWAFSRTSITAACAIYLSDRIIKRQPSLLREKNAHGVTPITMAESSFSIDVQKLYRAAARDYAADSKSYDILKPLKNKSSPASPGKKKPKLKRWSSQPNFEEMSPQKLMATRVFYLLWKACDEKKRRSIDVFLDFDVDDSGTVSKAEFAKGVKSLDIVLTLKQRKAVFSVVDQDNSGELEYMEISKEIKKAGRYPPPKDLLPVEIAALEKEKLSPSPKKKLKRKKTKKKIKLTAEQKVWNKVYMLMEKQRVKPIKLFHDIDTDQSGIITPNELRDGFKTLLDIDLEDEEFKACLKICDRDHSGEIDYREFSRAVKYGSPNRIESMQQQQLKLERLRSKGLTKEKRKVKEVDGEEKTENREEEEIDEAAAVAGNILFSSAKEV